MLKDKVSFHSCQFIQRSYDLVVVRIVPTPGLDLRQELDEVKSALREMLGREVKVEEEIANEPLRRGSQGKIPLIFSQILPPHSQGSASC